jgi:hypothetical protein
MPLSLPSDAVRKVNSVTSYDVSFHDELLLVTPSGAQTAITLFSGAVHEGTGRTVSVKNLGPGRVVLLANSGLVNGESYYTVEVTQVVTVKSDGTTDWLIASNDDLTHQIEHLGATGTLAIDWELGKNHVAQLTGPVTVELTGGRPGGHYVLVCWQDGTGGHGITWGANVAFSGNVTPDPALDAGAADLFGFYYDGDTYIMAGSLYTINS